MLPIILCDDCLEYGNYLKTIIEKFIFIEEFDMKVVLTTDSGAEVLHYVKEHPASYLYFLDVDLNDNLNDSSYAGITLAEELRRSDPRGFLVFVTAHAEFSLLTFQYQVEAMDYILKDHPETLSDRIHDCLTHASMRYASQHNQTHKMFSVHTGSHITYLKQDDILCFQSSPNAHKVKVITANAVYEQPGILREIQNQVDHRFLFSHKSCLVNTEHIVEMDKAKRILVLSNNLQIPVSARQMHSFVNLRSNT